MGRSSRAVVGPGKSAPLPVFLAGGAIGLLVGITIGVVCARPIAAAMRTIRRRRGDDGGPQFEYLTQ